MNTFFILSVSLAAGLIMAKLAKLLRLPAVTGFFLAGILSGPMALGRIWGGLNAASTSLFEGVNLLAFGFICFSLGTELNLKKLKSIGKSAAVISFVQALLTTLVVDVALVLVALNTDILDLSGALILGAVAATSAPAAKYMVTRQYRARGRTADMMLPVVAMDDALGIVIFAASVTAVHVANAGGFNLYTLLLALAVELCGSALIGLLLGLLLTAAVSPLKSEGGRLVACIAAVLAAVGLSYLMTELSLSVGGAHITLSSLIMCMTAGSVFCTLNKDAVRIMRNTDTWTYPLLIVFFVYAGMSLDFNILTIGAVAIGVIYIAGRAVGKYFGSGLGALITKEDGNIRRYLGLTLLPQGEVAIGLAAVAVRLFGEPKMAVVQAVVLFGTLIFELIGPALTRYALKKTGEMHGDNEDLPEEQLHDPPFLT